MKLYKSLKSALAVKQEVAALKLTLEGTFPAELLHFPQLRELYLEGSCQEIPELKSQWRELKVLSMKFSSLPKNLETIFQLPMLENLKLLEIPMERLPLSFQFIRCPLVSLTVKSCSLESIPEEISLLTSLQEINFSSNKLKSLPVGFRDLINLKRLNLDQNRFQSFPDFITTLPALRQLSIDGNFFSEEELARIQREFHITPH